VASANALKNGRSEQPVLHGFDRAAPARRARVVQCFVDADLRYMIPGLVEVCRKNGVDVSKLERGSLVPFINRERTFIKVLACNGSAFPVLGCYRLPRGRVYDLRVLGEIPSAFRADGGIDMDEAIRSTVEKYYERRKRKPAPPT